MTTLIDRLVQRGAVRRDLDDDELRFSSSCVKVRLSDNTSPSDKYVDYGDGASIYDVSALFDEKRGIPNILTKVTGAKAAHEDVQRDGELLLELLDALGGLAVEQEGTERRDAGTRADHDHRCGRVLGRAEVG